MAELLSKEKEFLKLNEQLNFMASNAMEHQTNATGQRINSEKSNHSRFHTYQKAKGQSTFLRKRGSGDGPTSDVGNNQQISQNPMGRFSMTMGRDTYRQGNRQTGNEPNQSPRITVTAPTPTPPPTVISSTMAHNSSVIRTYAANMRKNPPPTSNISTAARGNETFRAPNQNRFSRAPPTNTSTFTIKYRNPKFVKSPSLEVLLKDECSAIRNQTSSEDSPHLNGSVSSIAPEDSISNGRHSQASNMTIGSKKNVSTDGLIKFLKSKVTILEDDHSRLSEELSKQKELLEKALEQAKAMEKQRDQATTKNNALKEQLAKLESQLEQTTQHNKDQNKEYLKQQKDLETAKREIKILTQNNKNLEKRLYRANEDLENSRTSLSEMKKSEKELQEKVRLDLDDKDKQIKNLKKQRADLLNAYKKQLFLIDNLKRQNICLEQAKMLQFGEKEFSKILEWDMKS
ncbi:uncharacterized protein LOC133321115 [Musca vetustissima]|uniref:uncharacterized protein LOC133321115 n=1 Tax=Musca vetustissima TaxID=27455 RepID=UPI002AB6C5CA|nr:uncharacterized protein LOC133321115 [Musca vetustissima]